MPELYILLFSFPAYPLQGKEMYTEIRREAFIILQSPIEIPALPLTQFILDISIEKFYIVIHSVSTFQVCHL